MQLITDYKEIEALILVKTGLEIAIRCIDSDEIIFQPRNMGLIQNRVKVHFKLNKEYRETNWLKFRVSAGVFSSMVIPKVMALLDYMPKGSVARQDGATVYVMLDRIPQMGKFLSYYELTDINFFSSSFSIEASFSDKSGVDVNAIPPALEDSWSETTSLKYREIGNTFISIARAIFESDKVDEGIQTLKDKANELKDAHGDELRDVALSWLNKLRNPKNEPSSDADGITDEE